jgi:hypothetical protein
MTFGALNPVVSYLLADGYGKISVPQNHNKARKQKRVPLERLKTDGAHSQNAYRQNIKSDKNGGQRNAERGLVGKVYFKNARNCFEFGYFRKKHE